MVLTPSNMIEIGSTAPIFSLPDAVSGKVLSLDELKADKATVIMFICNHCPFVVHIQDKIAGIADAYQSQDIQFIAICSNDIDNYPEDAPDKMKERAEEVGFNFPYLMDDDQSIAKAYKAACTPDFFIFDSELACVYRGRFDDATPGKDVPVTGKDLCNALDNILAGKPVDPDQRPSMGCNIKWKT